MKEKQLDEEQYSEFLLDIKSRSYKKQIEEAKKLLEVLYPFEISEDNILITNEHKNEKLVVYVSKKNIRKLKSNKRKLFCILFSGVFLILLSIILIHKRYRYISDIANSKKLIEKENELKVKQHAELEIKAKKLHDEFDFYCDLEYPLVYNELSYIYSVLTRGSTIESISIERDFFTVEIVTPDSLKILKNIESNSQFNSVKMTRSSIDEKGEYVVLSGKITNHKQENYNSPNLEEVINYYENKVLLKKQRIEKLKNKSISEYIAKIRNELLKAECKEQYIQLKGSTENIELEYFVLSSSESILKFLNNIQSDSENLIDIKSFRLRNSEDSNKIQTTIIFQTGIEIKDEELLNDVEKGSGRQVSIEELNTVLFKKTKLRPVENTEKVQNNFQKATEILPELSYIGLTRIGKNITIIAKDDQYGVLYKIPFVEIEITEDCCWNFNHGYKAKIKGKYYEIKK